MGEEQKPAEPKPAAPKPPAAMAPSSWDEELPRTLKRQFGERVLETSTYACQNFILAKADAVISILNYLKWEADFDYLVDLTAVDWPKRTERFDLVYIVYSFRRNLRIRLKTCISDAYQPESAVSVYPTANWLEREVFDMFGIEFAGHPDLRRILMPAEWKGHPLRKDYPILQQDVNWVEENLGIESGQ